jgi:acetylglutamate kinase
MEPIYVIKIGGDIIDNDMRLSNFLSEFAAVKAKKILVHGGGKMATKMAGQLGVAQKMLEGRRITDAETLKIVTMVYAGYINKNIVALLQANNCDAIGLCGADGNLVLAHKRQHPDIDYGFAGDVDSVRVSLLKTLLENKFTVVVSPITHNQKGQLLNTNADTIAQEIAKALGKEFDVTLIYTFEKKGVLLDINDDNSVIRELDPANYRKLKENHRIFEGMIPKLDNAFEALNHNIQKVIIGNAEELQSLIKGDAGTTIRINSRNT